MELPLSPELEAKLHQLSVQSGRDTVTLVHEAVERLVDYDAWFLGQVESGLAQSERGEVLDHEAVGVRLETLLARQQRPA